MLYRLLGVLALVASCQGFVAPASAVAVRANGVATSPVMFSGGGASKAKKVVKKPVKKPVKKFVKKPVKKPVKKVVKRVVKKPVAKKVAKKVVKKVVKKRPIARGAAITDVGRSAQSFSTKIVSKENW